MTYRAKALRGAAALALLALVAGCSQGARSAAMVPTDTTAVAADNTYRERVKVETVAGGEETSPIWTSEISNGDFRQALETAMSLAKFKNTIGDLSLTVELLEIDQPLIGASLTVDSTVRYTIKDASVAVLFAETVQAAHTAQFSESFLANERLRLANEGSAKANIREFLKLLEIHGQASSNDAATS